MGKNTIKGEKKKLEVATPGFESAPQLPPAKKMRLLTTWLCDQLPQEECRINSIEVFFSTIDTVWTL